MSTENQVDWPSWFNSGWAFLMAIVGWVWHAGRLATKVSQLEESLDNHLKDYKKLQSDITSIKEALAYMKGSNHLHKNYRVGEEEGDDG